VKTTFFRFGEGSSRIIKLQVVTKIVITYTLCSSYILPQFRMLSLSLGGVKLYSIQFNRCHWHCTSQIAITWKNAGLRWALTS